MTGALLALPAHLRRRLSRALETGMLAPPWGKGARVMALGSAESLDEIGEALEAREEEREVRRLLGVDPGGEALGPGAR